MDKVLEASGSQVACECNKTELGATVQNINTGSANNATTYKQQDV